MSQDTVNITWIEAGNPFQCAHLALSKVCCRPKGFVYSSETDLCGLVPWSQEAETGIPILGNGNADLYMLNNKACQSKYKEHRYMDGNQNYTTCLSHLKTKTGYVRATGRCGKDAFIASAKTRTKIALLLELSQGFHLWLGLNDKVTEGVFVWEEDGTALSQEDMTLLFGQEFLSIEHEQKDCVGLQPPDTKLKVRKCLGSTRELASRDRWLAIQQETWVPGVLWCPTPGNEHSRVVFMTNLDSALTMLMAVFVYGEEAVKDTKNIALWNTTGGVEHL
ncbi:hypothetical protein ElyMa_001523800 [Elysia marginata]|uniref:C-type lectin domain-containing protein n=1 Tax=Elysia marginata TaxID=1093978 RepID=A0AAV4J869_9GAST|nr:hypothetical protein ElyMa_001523800 [Elysia marginata]